MRPSLPATLAVLAGLLAAAASTPSTGDGVSGASSTFDVSLTADSPSFEQRVTALLDAQVAIGDDGLIGLTALFDDADVGQVELSLVSETTGETNETSVLDPIAQPEVSIDVTAFAGCDGLSPCQEDLVIRFDRLEADVTNDLDFEWELDGFVSIVDPDATVETNGTLTFTLE